MYRIGLVLVAVSLLTVAPTRALVGGCGGGRMGRMEAVTGNITMRQAVVWASAPSLKKTESYRLLRERIGLRFPTPTRTQPPGDRLHP